MFILWWEFMYVLFILTARASSRFTNFTIKTFFFVIGVLYCNLDSCLFKRLQYCFFSSPLFMPLESLTSSTLPCREYCSYFTIRFFDEYHSIANIFLWVGCIFGCILSSFSSSFILFAPFLRLATSYIAPHFGGGF